MRPSSHRRVLGATASLVIAGLSPAIAQEQSHTADRWALGEGGKGRRDEGERGARQHCRSPHRVYLIEPVTRPAASRKVVTPLASVRAVSVTRPARSWKVGWRRCAPNR